MPQLLFISIDEQQFCFQINHPLSLFFSQFAPQTHPLTTGSLGKIKHLQRVVAGCRTTVHGTQWHTSSHQSNLFLFSCDCLNKSSKKVPPLALFLFHECTESGWQHAATVTMSIEIQFSQQASQPFSPTYKQPQTLLQCLSGHHHNHYQFSQVDVFCNCQSPLCKVKQKA